MKKKVLGVFLVLGLLWFVGCNKDNPTSPELASASNPSSLEIVSFTATSQTIKRGTSTTLSWEVINSTGVELNEETVEATGSRKVEPLENTTYILKATNSEGSISESIAVIVENGADVVMVSGPFWKEVTVEGYPPEYFCWRNWGTVKNKGTYKASFVVVMLYFYRVDGKYAICIQGYMDKKHLEPNEKIAWDTNEYGRCCWNGALDLSKTEYEITWSEHTETYTTGRISVSYSQ